MIRRGPVRWANLTKKHIVASTMYFLPIDTYVQNFKSLVFTVYELPFYLHTDHNSPHRHSDIRTNGWNFVFNRVLGPQYSPLKILDEYLHHPTFLIYITYLPINLDRESKKTLFYQIMSIALKEIEIDLPSTVFSIVIIMIFYWVCLQYLYCHTLQHQYSCC